MAKPSVIELNAWAVLDDPRLGTLTARQYGFWMNALIEACRRGSDVPDWAYIREWRCGGRKRRGDVFQRDLQALIGRGLVSPDPPHTLLGQGELWRFPPPKADRPNQADWSGIRCRIFARDNFTCAYCGSRGGELECDHIHPVARGGSHDDDNLTTACRTCNRSKRDKTIEEWRGAA